ncbi:glycine betaine/L-proline ABC transporter ATP-binding protein [Spirillospora sp. NPDC047279]|uniref:quaternary amine ABC transporter ATP-binding protein n=1 Tax=Spirillospora sp. NPDC047279 TaxID=3155478 RepID=UPI0034080AA3
MGVTPAVVDASFEVASGEIFVVMGLSGSGKSTLIRMLNGLLDLTSGTVEIDGEDLASLSGKALRTLRQSKVSMVFQHFALFPHRSVLANAAYGLEVQGVSKAEREKTAREFLGLVGLDGWEDKLPGQLSGGMRQRVGLARALAAGTDIILMDEAFSALDPLIRREVQDLLLDLQSRLGKTIVFITHDLNEAMRIGDRIAVMREGRIVQIGTAEEILTDPANDYVAQFVADVDRTRVLTAASVMEKPLVTVPANTGPRTALRTMREHQTSAAFVVGRDRTLAGTVEAATIADAVQDDVQALDGLIDTETIVPVRPDTPVADLFARSAESALPVPVTDESGTLLGVIPRVTLLAALGAINSHLPDDVPVDDLTEESSDEPMAKGGAA